jgi:tetratricopeptide (TPR) repeat protein
MDALPNKTMKLQLAGGWVTALVTANKLDVAKEVVERTVNELDTDAGKRLTSALEGTFMPLPAPPAATRDRPMRVQPPGMQEIIEAQNAIAAAKGDAIAAGNAGLAGNTGWRMSGSGEKLASHDWASLGLRAAKGGHPEEAKQAFERALDIFKTETSVDPAWTDEKIRFVREALPLEGGFELAANALNTSSPIDSSFRYSLAKLYAAAGDADRCRTLLEEAITSAPNDKGGSTMMAIAVMLDANGERERAERVFLDSIRYIHGEDFGIGGSRGLVVAAMRMNRLDLLEQVYNDTGPGMQLLLASAAAALSDPSVDLTREMEN